jgi:hypothetical protein
MKLNSITSQELLQLANENNFQITPEQANQLVALIKGKNINIFNPKERLNLLKQVAIITNNETAKKVNEMFQQFMQ